MFSHILWISIGFVAGLLLKVPWLLRQYKELKETEIYKQFKNKSMNFESRFGIGDTVDVRGEERDFTGKVESVTFTESKVFYSVAEGAWGVVVPSERVFPEGQLAEYENLIN